MSRSPTFFGQLSQVNQIKARGITYTYPGISTPALSEISFHWKAGEIIGLIGLSGSGKSTFGKLLKGIIQPQAGDIVSVDSEGTERALKPKDLIRLVGWADAHPEIQIFAQNVRDEVGFGPSNAGLSGKALDAIITESLNTLGMDPNVCLPLNPLALSGGEKRRVALAGIIACSYGFYIFDEPTAGLDYRGRTDFQLLVRKLSGNGCGIIWITHNIRLLDGLAGRIVVFDNGRLIEGDSASHIDLVELENDLIAGKHS